MVNLTEAPTLGQHWMGSRYSGPGGFKAKGVDYVSWYYFPECLHTMSHLMITARWAGLMGSSSHKEKLRPREVKGLLAQQAWVEIRILESSLRPWLFPPLGLLTCPLSTWGTAGCGGKHMDRESPDLGFNPSWTRDQLCQ